MLVSVRAEGLQLGWTSAQLTGGQLQLIPMETCGSEPAVKVELFTVQNISQSAESSSVQRKVTLMMPSLYNQGHSSSALEYLSF